MSRREEKEKKIAADRGSWSIPKRKTLPLLLTGTFLLLRAERKKREKGGE